MSGLVVTWTDGAVWSLGLAALLFLLHARRSAIYRAAFRRLRARTLPVIYAGILACFALTAALDSIHLRRGGAGGAVVSALDLALTDLRASTERTYSAPLATRLLTRQRLAVPRGDEASERPLLVWPHHLLGTDKVGQDVLYRALKGCRTGLLLGALTLLLALPPALILGISAGYFGGLVDEIIQYLHATFASIPGILLISAAMLILESRIDKTSLDQAADTRLLWLCLVMGLTSFPGLSRLLRGETLKLREQDHITAARAFGVGHAGIIVRHVLPNVLHVVLIYSLLRFSGLVLAEIVLSYLGMGVDPSTESWGNLVNYARAELTNEPMVWWNLAAAFLFTLGLVLPVNLLGDAVRDALDPRLRME